MILVTGGTGLLGSHVLFQLLQSGKPIRAMKRPNSDLLMVEKLFNHYSNDGSQLFSKIEWVEADVLDITSLENIFDDVEEVYHCAAMVSFEKRHYNKMMKINREGTANMINYSLSNDVQKFCHVSSTAAIGKGGVGKKISDPNHPGKTIEINSESNKWVQGPQTSGYAITKYSAEKEAWRGVEEGLNVAIVNPSVLLGPGNIEESSNTIFNNVKNGLKYYTEGVNAMADVRDVAQIMQILMDENIFADRFLCFTENISFKDLTTKIAHEFGKTPPKKAASPFMTNLAWRFESFRTKLFGGTPKLTRENAESAHAKVFYTNKKIIDKIGYKFRSMDDTVKNAVDFYSKETK